ncbi:MAG: periplasmic protein TonB [Verrucomicrobiota bacterium]
MSSRCTTTFDQALAGRRGGKLAIQLLFWVGLLIASVGRPGATIAASIRPDAELRQGFIGTWQVELSARRFYPLSKGFVTYRDDGEFVMIAIGAISGFEGRVDFKGKWRVEKGQLLERATEAPAPEIVGRTETSRIVTIEPNRITLHDEHGTLQMRRDRVPAKLPPTSKWIQAMFRSAGLRRSFALKTPQPSYPYAARKDGAEGRGIFRLIVDPHGNTRSVETLQSTGHIPLDQAATDALKEWRFVPGKVKELVVPVLFTMHGL